MQLTEDRVGYDELVAGISETVGYQRAEEVVAAAAEQVGLQADAEYGHGDAETICRVIADEHDQSLSLVANTLRNRIRLRRLEGTDTTATSLFERTTDAVVELGFDGKPVVRRVNEKFTRAFDVDPARVVGEPVTGLDVPPGDADQWTDVLSQVRAGEDIDIEVRDDDRAYRLRGVGLVEPDGVSVAYFVYTDITEQKRREAELRRRNEHLEAFASIVSHDLRNPLNIAEGYFELARSNADVPHAEEIAEAHERMGAIIDDMLTLARLGQTISEPEPVDLAPAAREAWEHVETPAADLSVPDATVQSDRSRLLALFENLFRNAIEHGRPADDAGRPLAVRVGLDGDCLFVADDGVGIPADERDAVLDAGHTSNEEGTGLGLFIVKEIAQAHGWSVAVTESEADGARFEFTGVERA
ncbi:sensor histidine kinase [Halorarius halobius]|uniref:sensor histidine kinase n=1 Tax=Halorarius halobius TaxID=2962671 RepID=UPI0020CC01A0|nr:PAS domain-containing sensor histidine kinase [Halorarius halobius]